METLGAEMEKDEFEEVLQDPLSDNADRLHHIMGPIRRKIRRDAQDRLRVVEEQEQSIVMIMRRYNITEPLDERFFNELFFHLDNANLITPPATDNAAYWEKEQQIVALCRADLALRRANQT